MRQFIHSMRAILDAGTKRRLLLTACGAVVLAVMDAVAIALVLPLVRAIDGIARETIPSTSRALAVRLDANSPEELAGILAAIVFVTFVLKGLLAVAYLRWNLGFLMRGEADLASSLLRVYLHAPYSYHLQHNSAELQRTIHLGVRQVYRETLVGLVGACADGVLIAAVGIVLLVLEPTTALAAIAYFTVVGVGYQRVIHHRAQTAGRELHEEGAHAFRVVQQSVSSTKELALTQRQNHFADELHRVERRMASRQATLLLLNQLPRYYLELALVIGVASMSLVLFSRREPADAVAVIGLFLAAGFRVLPSLNRVLVALGYVRSGLAPLRQISDDLATLGPRVVTFAADEPSLDWAHIAVEGVTFAYEGAAGPVLRDVSLRISAGESVAFVGASGAGKTTLVDVILGLLEPDSGAVTIDSRPLSELRAAFQRTVGYVPQSVSLLDDTLSANIAFAVPEHEIDTDRLTAAVREAQLEDVVAALPDGLDSVIGEAGVRLSGGQRQRIGIARALYQEPRLLVLDEATSSLDSATELRITETIEALSGELTVMVIAHRLSTVRACDRIFFLENGRIVQHGSFPDLMARSPGFAALVRLGSLTPLARET